MSAQPINKTVISQGSIVNQISSSISVSRQDHSNSLKQSVIDSFVHQKYSHINTESKTKVFFFEFVGTTFFVALALSTVVPLWADIYVGIGILIGVILAGPVSGANLNPSVTLCNCLKKQNKFKWIMFPLYYFAQLSGTLLALVYTQLIDDFKVAPLMPQSQDAVGCLRVVASQMIGSFILIFFILQISNPNTTFIDNQLSGYMFIVFFIHTARKYAPASGGTINSTIALSLAIGSFVQKGNVEGLFYSLLWFAGDLLGTIIAVIFYERVFQPNVEYVRKIRRDYQEQTIQSLLLQNTFHDKIEEMDQN